MWKPKQVEEHCLLPVWLTSLSGRLYERLIGTSGPSSGLVIWCDGGMKEWSGKEEDKLRYLIVHLVWGCEGRRGPAMTYRGQRRRYCTRVRQTGIVLCGLIPSSYGPNKLCPCFLIRKMVARSKINNHWFTMDACLFQSPLGFSYWSSAASIIPCLSLLYVAYSFKSFLFGRHELTKQKAALSQFCPNGVMLLLQYVAFTGSDSGTLIFISILTKLFSQCLNGHHVCPDLVPKLSFLPSKYFSHCSKTKINGMTLIYCRALIPTWVSLHGANKIYQHTIIQSIT